MKTYKTIFAILALFSLLFLIGCSADNPTESSPTVNGGNTDFSRLVAIGASYEAGYQDNYLIGENELNSYPAMIAQQMGLTAGDGATNDFVVPYIDTPGAGTKMELGTPAFDAAGNPQITQTDVAALPTNLTYPAPYNNLGVPGALSWEVFNTTSSATSLTGNPMFDLILRPNPAVDPAEHLTMIEQAIALQPTFVIIGVLGNDVLGAATGGEIIPGILPVPADAYAGAYQTIVDSLKSALPGVGLIGVNIPDVTTLPYCTTVPYQVDVPGVGLTALVIQTGEGEVRQATADDLILLPASAAIGDVSGEYGPEGLPVGLNIAAPLVSSLVLDAAEIAVIQTTTGEYNTYLDQIADTAGFPIVDGNSLMTQLATDGIEIWTDITLTADYISGGAFSLDGVHLTTLGYVIVANAFIEKINEFYGSDIPKASYYPYF